MYCAKLAICKQSTQSKFNQLCIPNGNVGVQVFAEILQDHLKLHHPSKNIKEST
jgi:hypothetical protein